MPEDQTPQAPQIFDLSISLLRANLLGTLLSVILTLLLFGIYYLVNRSFAVLYDTNALVLILSIVVGIAVHEWIHGISWQLASGKSREVIRYGINWKLLTPYAHCREPILVKHYRFGILMPLLWLGILPFGIAVLIEEPNLFLFGTIFSIAASGDIIVYWIIRVLPSDAQVQDHPKRAGCFAIIQPTSKIS